jgi:hypothetical protein
MHLITVSLQPSVQQPVKQALHIVKPSQNNTHDRYPADLRTETLPAVRTDHCAGGRPLACLFRIVCANLEHYSESCQQQVISTTASYETGQEHAAHCDLNHW